MDTTLSENIAFSNGFVSPSDDQLITLTYGQLRSLIIGAVSEAIQPLQDRVESLETPAISQGEEIAALKATVAEQKADYESMNLLRCRDFVNVSRRVNALERKKDEPGKTETARSEKIEKYLASRPDHRATYETLKGHLGIDKDLLGDAIKTLMAASPGRYGIVGVPGDKRKRALIMLPK